MGPQLAGKPGESRRTEETRNRWSRALSFPFSLVANTPQSVLKTASGATRSWVRIPVLPPSNWVSPASSAWRPRPRAPGGPCGGRLRRNLGASALWPLASTTSASQPRGVPSIRTVRLPEPTQSCPPCTRRSSSWTSACRRSTESPPRRTCAVSRTPWVLVLTTFGEDEVLWGRSRQARRGSCSRTAPRRT